MFKDFDVLKLDDGGYELIAGHAVMHVSFTHKEEKALFDALLGLHPKKYKPTLKKLMATYGKEQVYAFFSKLKDAGLVFYDEDQLDNGQIYGREKLAELYKENLKKKHIGLLGHGMISTHLKNCSLKNSILYLDIKKNKSESDLDSFVKNKDFLIVDASSYHPETLSNINKLAFDQNVPWLLVQGIFEGMGHVGPLFYTHETGCYECFKARLRSNTMAQKTYDRYETWLVDQKAFSKSAHTALSSYELFLSQLVVMEVEKFLLDYSFAQSYGTLLEVDFRDYSVKPHRLYKKPFCQICYQDIEYRPAPWMDAITLPKGEGP